MSSHITFTVRENNALYNLALGSTMIHFMESDFTYFRQQCIEVAQKYQTTGEYSPEKASVLKEYIRGCHPYCNVLISTAFDSVVIDCIIDYLCASEGIGLEALWVKQLSATDKFGQAVFHRISEYKTGYAINQWTNLLRMQMYAASKTEFLFDGDMVSTAEYAARKLYFDMAFTLSAQALGCDVRDLPQVRRYSAPLLPNSTSMMKRAVNTLNPVIASMSSGRKVKLPVKGRECLHDQTAGMAANAIMTLQRPLLPEVRQLMKTYKNLPSEVYEPSCFKAIIDLEFDKLLEMGLLLQKSAETGTYTVVTQSGDIPAAEDTEIAMMDEADEIDSKPAAQTAHDKITAAEAESPALKGKIPSIKVKLPIPAEQIPSIKVTMPALVEQIPSITAETPAPVEQIPSIKVEPPAPVEQIPSIKVEPPVPVVQIPSIKVEPPVPVEQIPSIEAEAPAPADQIPSAQEAAPAPKGNKSPDIAEGLERVKKIREMSEDPYRALSKIRTPQEINTRCNLIWNDMRSRIGWDRTEEENREWFKNLVDIRCCMGTGEMTPENLDKFLDATEEVYGITSDCPV